MTNHNPDAFDDPDDPDDDDLVPATPDPLDDDGSIDALSADEYNEFTYGREDDDF